MIVTRYKPLFGISASYELTGLGVQTQGIAVNGIGVSETRLLDCKLKPQYKDNTATIFYEGVETPPVAPLTCEPSLEISTDEYFYFGIDIAGKEKLNKLKIHSSAEVAAAIGFPVLYDAKISIADGPATITAKEDVKVMLPVFTFRAVVADTGITADYANLEVTDEAGGPVDMDMQPVKANDKAIDGVDAIPEFAFSVDASALAAGIYTFTVGGFSKKYFIANGMDVAKLTGLVRVLKNEFLEYRKDLSDKDYALFELQLPAA